MKHFNTLILASLLSILFFSCQKELHFPEPEPTSQFTVVTNETTYHLKIEKQSVVLRDTAHIQLRATSPEISVIMNFMSAKHTNGKGDYYLKCCTNDVYDRTTGTQKHWEIDHISGGTQNGSVVITKMDDTGFSGTYTMYGNDYAISRTAKKEFKGTFVIIY